MKAELAMDAAWLAKLEETLAERLPDESHAHPNLRAAMAHSLLGGGKRLRPQLLAATAGLGEADPKALLLAAAAVEMMHCYSLIHDDLPAMDDDDWRRGRPTCHKVYGEAMAILAGDALQALSFETLTAALATAGLDTREALACLADLAVAAGPLNLVGGQAGDLEEAPPTGDEAALLWIHERKTAAMIRLSLGLGARLGRLPAERRRELERAGQLLGLAFQTVDDLLDAEASLQELGKTPGKDAAQGKRTMLSILGAEEARRRAEDYLAEALALIPAAPATEPLRELADRLVHRKR